MAPMKSLFWQLYFSITLGLVVVIALFFGLTIYLDHSSDTFDFYLDTRAASKRIFNIVENQHKVTQSELEQLTEEHFFDIKIIKQRDINSTISSLDFIETIELMDIYHSEDGLKAGIEPLPKINSYLVIQDIDIDPSAIHLSEEMKSEFQREEAEEDQQQQLLLFALASTLFAIGLVLIITINRISRHLSRLINTSMKWSQGKLKERAQEDAPVPLNQLAINFNKMAGSLDQSNEEQQVLMHAISHELRTPLSKLHLALNLLQRQDDAENPLINDLARYVDELDELTHQILMFSKITNEENKDSNETVYIKPLLIERVQELKLLHPEKQVTLTDLSESPIHGSSFYLQILIDNIIGNALKYSKSTVTISFLSKPGQHQLEINDDGPGIPTDQQERILKPFSRLDESRNKATGGFGLGLAICKSIVDRYNGTIAMEKSHLGGLRLIVSFKP